MLLYIIAILGLFLLNGLLSMAEIAIVTARRARLNVMAEKGRKGAAAAIVLARDPGKLLSALQSGITLIGILTGAIGGAAITEPLALTLARVPVIGTFAPRRGVRHRGRRDVLRVADHRRTGPEAAGIALPRTHRDGCSAHNGGVDARQQADDLAAGFFHPHRAAPVRRARVQRAGGDRGRGEDARRRRRRNRRVPSCRTRDGHACAALRRPYRSVDHDPARRRRVVRGQRHARHDRRQDPLGRALALSTGQCRAGRIRAHPWHRSPAGPAGAEPRRACLRFGGDQAAGAGGPRRHACPRTAGNPARNRRRALRWSWTSTA